MRILLDHNVPGPLKTYLSGHICSTAVAEGWDELENGFLLNAAEKAGFHLFLTGDKNIRYQQNFSHRKISIVVLGNTRWGVLRRYVDLVLGAVGQSYPGSFFEVEIPFS